MRFGPLGINFFDLLLRRQIVNLPNRTHFNSFYYLFIKFPRLVNPQQGPDTFSQQLMVKFHQVCEPNIDKTGSIQSGPSGHSTPQSPTSMSTLI